MKQLFLFGIFLCGSLNLLGQENQIDEKELNNRISVGWAYYGRGNGTSIIIDREFSEIISQGVGFEEYFIDEELESSFFLVTDFHLEKVLNFKSDIEIYPGFEYGSFGGEFEIHSYLGISIQLSPKSGIYTELGSRGVFGLYTKF